MCVCVCVCVSVSVFVVFMLLSSVGSLELKPAFSDLCGAVSHALAFAPRLHTEFFSVVGAVRAWVLGFTVRESREFRAIGFHGFTLRAFRVYVGSMVHGLRLGFQGWFYRWTKF